MLYALCFVNGIWDQQVKKQLLIGGNMMFNKAPQPDLKEGDCEGKSLIASKAVGMLKCLRDLSYQGLSKQ
jgi:hypothetical protein